MSAHLTFNIAGYCVFAGLKYHNSHFVTVQFISRMMTEIQIFDWMNFFHLMYMYVIKYFSNCIESTKRRVWFVFKLKLTLAHEAQRPLQFVS